MLKFAKLYDYACTNGCRLSYEDYVAGLYTAYREICRRCRIEPLSQAEWAST